jgi:hypothetical protein
MDPRNSKKTPEELAQEARDLAALRVQTAKNNQQRAEYEKHLENAPTQSKQDIDALLRASREEARQRIIEYKAKHSPAEEKNVSAESHQANNSQLRESRKQARERIIEYKAQHSPTPSKPTPKAEKAAKMSSDAPIPEPTQEQLTILQGMPASDVVKITKPGQIEINRAAEMAEMDARIVIPMQINDDSSDLKSELVDNDGEVVLHEEMDLTTLPGIPASDRVTIKKGEQFDASIAVELIMEDESLLLREELVNDGEVILHEEMDLTVLPGIPASDRVTIKKEEQGEQVDASIAVELIMEDESLLLREELVGEIEDLVESSEYDIFNDPELDRIGREIDALETFDDEDDLIESLAAQIGEAEEYTPPPVVSAVVSLGHDNQTSHHVDNQQAHRIKGR